MEDLLNIIQNYFIEKRGLEFEKYPLIHIFPPHENHNRTYKRSMKTRPIHKLLSYKLVSDSSMKLKS